VYSASVNYLCIHPASEATSWQEDLIFNRKGFIVFVLAPQTLPFIKLVTAWHAQPSSDIVAVGVGLLRHRTQQLINMLRAGLVQAEVRRLTSQLGSALFPAGPKFPVVTPPEPGIAKAKDMAA